MLQRSHTQRRLFALLIAISAQMVAFSGSACKSGSVVSDNSAQNATANSTASSTPAAVAPQSSTNMLGQATAATPDGKNTDRKIVSNIPATMTTAKPVGTPEPDPFPARPEPPVVMKDGKIVQQWPAPADAADVVNPEKSKPEAAKMGREFYMQVCAACHGKSGQGNGPNSNYPKRDGKPLPPTNLTSKVVQANTDGELFWKITNGRSPMPAHRVRLDDEQRWFIVTFLRTLKK